ncbi:MAG: M48 family metalloprotease [Deltaproteobacteria bacterium]|nr:M48 family metalloprotease [Deltaproteobacteria bacterium]
MFFSVPLPTLAAEDGGEPEAEKAEASEKQPEDAQEEEEKRDKKPPVLTIPQDDRRAGAEASQQVAQAMGIMEGPLADYVKKVGARVARHGGHVFKYTFNVVNEDTPNAFALPGGFIYVSRGLLILANSEDEVANVLGHEITHVSQRHAAARQQIVEGVPGFFQFMQFASLAGYGRDQERTADKLGQKLAGAAGYDPHGMSSFMKQLDFAERLSRGSSRIPSWRDSHPSSRERVADNAARASRVQWAPKPGIVEGRAGFLALLDGLAIGLPASEGVFKRTRFLHPDMGFTIRFPDGWETRNTHSAVGALSPERNAQVVLEFGGTGTDLDAAAEKYIAKMGKDGLRLEKPEKVKVGGRKALRSRGTASTGRGSFHAVVTWLLWKHGDDEVIFRIMGLSLSRQHEGIFVNVARSFRPITPREIATIKVERQPHRGGQRRPHHRSAEQGLPREDRTGGALPGQDAIGRVALISRPSSRAPRMRGSRRRTRLRRTRACRAA